jgi:hypothetical protein
MWGCQISSQSTLLDRKPQPSRPTSRLSLGSELSVWTRLDAGTRLWAHRPAVLLRADCRGAGAFRSDWRRALSGRVVLVATSRCLGTRGSGPAFVFVWASEQHVFVTACVRFLQPARRLPPHRCCSAPAAVAARDRRGFRAKGGPGRGFVRARGSLPEKPPPEGGERGDCVLAVFRRVVAAAEFVE